MEHREVTHHGKTFRELTDYAGYYVSREGQVLSLKNNEPRVLKPSFVDGYPRVDVYKDQQRYTRRLHLLVASQWLEPKPSSTHQLNHKDGRRDNANASNLEWVTPSENTLHSYRYGAKQGMRRAQVLNKVTAMAIRESTEPRRLIAQRYGCSVSTVSAIRTGKVWSVAA